MALSVQPLATNSGQVTGTSLQGSGSNLQGSVGTQAQGPGGNLPAPTNSIPNNQAVPTTSVNDLSSQYADVNGTIYNKQNGQVYSTPQQFFNAAGVNSFNNLKFDTNWNPATSQISGTAGGQSFTMPVQSSSTGLLPTLASNNTSVSTPASTPLYVPPNQGTTGVSQGGIVGNLLANNNNNPAYTSAVNAINEDKTALSNLGTTYNTQGANIYSNSGDLSLAGGRQGILNALYASNQATLSNKLAADQAVLNAANTQQGTVNTGLASAASANAPTTNPQTGGLVSPTANTTTGVTTSGAANLNSLIGQRPSPSSPGTTEYYNTSTGQGFSTPQQLADFVNQQTPGANVNAQNVFSYLSSNGGSSPNSNNGLNPIANVNQTAQAIINGSMTYNQAIAQGGTVTNYANLLNQAILQAGGNVTALQAQGQGTQSTLANIPPQQSAATAAAGIANTITSFLSQNPTINPSDLTASNNIQQWISGQQLGNAQYQTFFNDLNEYANTLAPVLGVGGDPTNMKTQIAQSLVNGLASGQSISTVLQNLTSLAQQKIQNEQIGATGGTTPVNQGLQMPPGFFAS